MSMKDRRIQSEDYYEIKIVDEDDIKLAERLETRDMGGCPYDR